MMSTTSAPSDLERKYAEWARQAARSAGNQDLAALRSRSPDGLIIEPLYTRLLVEGKEGLPGIAPHIRGSDAAGALARAGWEVRQLHALPEPEAAAAAIRDDLAGGVRGIWLKLDLAGDESALGVHIDSLDALATTTAALDPTRHSLAFDPGPWLLPLAALVLAQRQRSGDDGEGLSLGFDPLGVAAVGALPSPADALAETASVLPALLKGCPRARLFAASGLPFHDAGATAPQELACILANAIALLRFGESLGLPADLIAARIELRLATDADLFTSAAKCRALRRLWSRVMEVAGIDVRPFVHAVTGRRMLARVDPWTNLLRLTAATAAGVLGGAQAITTLPFDDPLGPPDAFSRRLARNTQAILALESRMFQPLDPLGGSFFVQRLTDELAREAWTLLQDIEAAGGMAAALTAGLVQDWIAAARKERERAIATRMELLVGVSAFVDLDEEVREAALPLRTKHEAQPRKPAIDPKAHALAATLQALAGGARLVAPKAREPAIRFLAPFRLAEPFEQLRAQGMRYRARHGDFPQLTLLCFGPPGEWATQATFAKNLFEAGGIRVVSKRVAAEREAAVAATANLDAAFCGLCGSLDVALEEGLVKRLRARGIKRLYRFGDSGAAGYDARPTEGVDVLALLNDAWSTLVEETA